MGKVVFNILVGLVVSAIFMFSCTPLSELSAKGNTYSVKEYGAKGDGRTDDTKAIKKCIRTALNNGGGKIVFPLGQYQISEPLIFNVHGLSKATIVEGNGAVIKFNKVLSSALFFRNRIGGQGNIRVQNLGFEGLLTPARIKKLFDGVNFTYGLRLWNFEQVEIKNCVFKNFYGGAIHVRQEKILTQAAWNKNITSKITGNKILNVFGMKPTKYYENGKLKSYDNYGDGIYVMGGKQSIISNNIINNDLYKTKHLGRGGIVLGSAAIDYEISNNNINGYERGIHIELTQGGHKIEDNTITGFGTGILISSPDLRSKLKPIDPMAILNNRIINSNLPNIKLRGCIRPSGHIYFYKSSTVIENTLVSGNELVAVNKPFAGKFIFVSQQRKLRINNNKIEGRGSVRPAFYSYHGIKQFNYNTLLNLAYANCRPGAEESVGNKKTKVYSEFINRSKKTIKK